MLQHVRQRIVLFDVRRLGQQMHDDFGVGRALENVAVLFVFLAQKRGVDQIAVVRHRDRAHQILPQQRLGVAEFARAGGGIADMTDGRLARQVLP